MGQECATSFNLFIGDDLNQQLLGVEENGDPVDLTSVTDIQITFPNDPDQSPPDPTYTASLVNGQISVVDATLGKFQLSLAAADTALFLALMGYDVDIVVILGGKTTTYRIPAGANILNRSSVQFQ